MHIVPFLMFEGRAEEAMTFYTSLLPDSRIESIERCGAGGPGAEGSVLRAVFSLAGRSWMCIDSPMKHGFTFTPASSIFVETDSEAQLKQLVDAFSENGTVLMPPGNYGFSTAFAWVQDRFGVSWQLNLV